MDVGPDGHRFARTKDQFAEDIAVVHHIEERHARIDAGRREDLEERAVSGVVRIFVAGAVVVAAAEPRL